MLDGRPLCAPDAHCTFGVNLLEAALIYPG